MLLSFGSNWLITERLHKCGMDRRVPLLGYVPVNEYLPWLGIGDNGFGNSRIRTSNPESLTSYLALLSQSRQSTYVRCLVFRRFSEELIVLFGQRFSPLLVAGDQLVRHCKFTRLLLRRCGYPYTVGDGRMYYKEYR